MHSAMKMNYFPRCNSIDLGFLLVFWLLNYGKYSQVFESLVKLSMREEGEKDLPRTPYETLGELFGHSS
jgi:hypothetical protein